MLEAFHCSTFLSFNLDLPLDAICAVCANPHSSEKIRFDFYRTKIKNEGFVNRPSLTRTEQNRTETLLTLRSIQTYEDKNKYIR